MNFRYNSSDRRDRRLDWIRGYAVLAMSVNHFGLGQSLYHPLTGGSVFLINAAEVFFFVSGVTLGLVTSRQAALDGVTRCYRRSWEIYLYVLFLALGGALLFEGMRDSAMSYLGAVLTLQEAPFWGDVLVAYILFLFLTPPVLLLLHGRRAWIVVGAIAAVYAISQVAPNHLALPFASFRNIAANAPLFFGGLVLGARRDVIAAWWGRVRVRALVDAILVIVGVSLLVLYATDYAWLPALGEAMEAFDIGARESRMPFGALLIVGMYLRLIWLLVDRLWTPLHHGLGWLVEPLGRDALFAYVAHAFFMEIAWIFVSAAGIAVDAETTLGATAMTSFFIAMVYGSVQLKRLVMTTVVAGEADWRRRVRTGTLPTTAASPPWCC